MADIQQLGDRQQFNAGMVGMADKELLAQDLVQQGAIHAVSFLLANGCNEQTAGLMLKSLRESAALLRGEADRRGKPSLFAKDQTVFQ